MSLALIFKVDSMLALWPGTQFGQLGMTFGVVLKGNAVNLDWSLNKKKKITWYCDEIRTFEGWDGGGAVLRKFVASTFRIVECTTALATFKISLYLRIQFPVLIGCYFRSAHHWSAIWRCP